MKHLPSPLPTGQPPRIPAAARPLLRNGPDPRDEASAAIGTQIKALRLAAGKSGGELADRAGISGSMLSRIERGLVSPSVQTLERISNALQVPMARFFSDQAKRNDFCHVRAGNGIRVDRSGAVEGYQYELLGHLLSGNMVVEPYLVTLLPDAPPYGTFQHPGIKLIHLLSGRIRYRYAGKTVSVGPGDSMLFEASTLHGIAKIDEAPVSYLSIVFTLR